MEGAFGLGASDAATAAFFRALISGGGACGRVQCLSLTLDGVPIAMLANLITPPGSFSFKIAFDEQHARFSPGVLIEIANLAILARDGIDWMDSCAIQGHSMIESLWAERRSLIRVTLPLAGQRNRAIFSLCRTAERASAAMRERSRASNNDRHHG